MKNIKLHTLVIILVVIAELIGIRKFTVGVGSVVLLPMLYALILGILLTPKFTKIASEKEMDDAGSLIGITLMLLMAKYGTTIGPSIPLIIKSSPALILQEFGNIGTVLLGVPLAVMIGLKREAIGAAHSVAREPNVALIGERFGLDSQEGEGVLGVYIIGTSFWNNIYRIVGIILGSVHTTSSLCTCYGIRSRFSVNDDSLSWSTFNNVS